MKNNVNFSTFISFTAIMLLFALSTQAKVWRVNNRAGVSADFTALSAAISSPLVNQGDTIYLEASSGSHGTITLNKMLTIIGPGFYLAENPETQADLNSALIDILYINNGSQGSVIKGCTMARVDINTSNILFQGNLVWQNTTSSNYAMLLGANISNVIIRNNYIRQTYTTYGSEAIRAWQTGTNNIIIQNNFIEITSTTSGRYALYFTSGFSGIIENNILYGVTHVNNAEFHNNIITFGAFSCTNCNVTHNIGNSTQFGTINGNQQNVSPSTIFLGATGNSTDGQWRLRPGSPAIGTGVGGTDVGMFGGATPYKLSGLPNIPAIYEINHNIDYENQLLEIEFSVKSHN
ncbi:MAG: hypothetical protein KGZ97_04395 [Bacteroidetes bacterium]|nr:hypothetical protein [Bacteroidota bacterium]